MKIKLFIYENHMQTILVIIWHCIKCIQNDETHNNIKKMFALAQYLSFKKRVNGFNNIRCNDSCFVALNISRLSFVKNEV